MNRAIVVMSLLIAAQSGWAAEPPQGAGAGPGFDKIKSEVVGKITARIARNQEELTCVQGAKKPSELKAFREKFREEMKEQREHNKAERREMRK